MHDSLIILAGGMSSRMKKPSTSRGVSSKEENEANTRSKSLISVDNSGRPLLDYLLYNAKKAGYTNIYIVINEKGTLFREFYGQKKQGNHFKGLNISFPVQHIPKNRVKPFGTADAIYQAIEQFPELKSSAFTVCNSDNLYSIQSLNLLRRTNHMNGFISYDRDSLEFPIEKIYAFAIVNLDSENHLKSIIEKPSKEEAEKYKDADNKIRVSMNIFKLDGKMMYPYLKECPINPKRNEKELPTALLNMISKNPKSVIGIPLAQHVPDLTAKDDIVIIKKYLQKHYPSQIDW